MIISFVHHAAGNSVYKADAFDTLIGCVVPLSIELDSQALRVRKELGRAHVLTADVVHNGRAVLVRVELPEGAIS